MLKKIKRLVGKLVRDKNDRVVLWQSPNLPLVGWLVFTVIAYFLVPGILKTGYADLGGACLVVWSYLEITEGVNYFRRLLGAAVLLVILIGYFY